MRHRCGSSVTVQGQTSMKQSRVRPFLHLATALLIGCTSLSLSAQSLQGNSGAAAPGQKKSAPRAAKPAQKANDPVLSGLQDALKNPELMTEFGQLIEKIQKGVQYPAARNQSHILAKLPESTVFYVALPNYGESAHQAAQIFKEELAHSPELKAFLSKNKLESFETKVEEGLQKFYEFSEFLGDEVVVEGRVENNEPTGVLVAEIKKPGLPAFLGKLNDEVFTNAGDRLRVFDPQQLAAAGDKEAAKGPAVLVRPDFLAIGLSVKALREFNSEIEQRGPRLTSDALGRRLAQSYHAGATTVLGLDLHQLIGLIPITKPQDRDILEKTGFSDVSYLVSESTMSATGSTNRFKLKFQGPRRGIASWISSPAPMDGLDFVSSHPAFVTAMILKSPAQIFDDVREIAGEAAFASLPQMEQQLHLNLRGDILAKLTGEVVLETQFPSMGTTAPAKTAFDGSAPAVKPPSFKVILKVSDSAALQQALTRLLAIAPLQSGQRVEDGVIITTLTSPSGKDQMEINYFFLDGYLVVASDRAGAREALRAHRSGDSLAKSPKLRNALASGESQNVSLLVYQDAGKMLGTMMAVMPQELRQLMSASGGDITINPTVVSMSADDSSFYGVSNNSNQASATVVLAAAAIAIPSLIRSREAANESAAAATVRTLNTAELTYSMSYSDKGFASSLAALGPGTDETCAESAEHGCLIDGVVGNATCTPGKWCEKGGYRFAIRSTCFQGKCLHYVVTATPASAATGGKSFCSTDDALIRTRAGEPPAAALTYAECRTWKPLQ